MEHVKMNDVHVQKETIQALYHYLHQFAATDFYPLFLNWVIEKWQTALQFDSVLSVTQHDFHTIPVPLRKKLLTTAQTFSDFLDSPTGELTQDAGEYRTEYYHDQLAYYFYDDIQFKFSIHHKAKNLIGLLSHEMCLAKAYSLGYLVLPDGMEAHAFPQSTFATWTLFHFKQAINRTQERLRL